MTCSLSKLLLGPMQPHWDPKGEHKTDLFIIFRESLPTKKKIYPTPWKMTGPPGPKTTCLLQGTCHLTRIQSLVIMGHKWLRVVTHGPFGEYGHPQHRELYLAVTSLAPKHAPVWPEASRSVRDGLVQTWFWFNLVLIHAGSSQPNQVPRFRVRFTRFIKGLARKRRGKIGKRNQAQGSVACIVELHPPMTC